jgi:hypothetical protein
MQKIVVSPCALWPEPSEGHTHFITMYNLVEICCSLLGRIPDKNDRCAFTRGSRGEVMIFFEKNKVLGVEPNRVLHILEGI